MQPRLIVVRGNSGAGKSSVVEGVRAAYGRGVAVIEQDYVRRSVFLLPGCAVRRDCAAARDAGEGCGLRCRGDGGVVLGTGSAGAAAGAGCRGGQLTAGDRPADCRRDGARRGSGRGCWWGGRWLGSGWRLCLRLWR
ncbi:hypothetical protein [Kribbella sandramycini]|uniref:hypothetical protein n=1 Tax=Kribbella sandramycini TaxID=60450 RepID=UPI003B52DE05